MLPARLIPLSALLLVLSLAGCGGGGGDEETTAATEGGATEGATETAVDEATAERVQELLRLARQPQYAKPKKESLRIADAQGELLTIAARNPPAIEPLLRALEKPDYELVIDMYPFFIQLGKPGSERVLGEALLRLEPSPQNDAIVLAFFDSGNRKLSKTARKWAADHGFTISGTPSAGLWGTAGVYGPAIAPGTQNVPRP